MYTGQVFKIQSDSLNLQVYASSQSWWPILSSRHGYTYFLVMSQVFFILSSGIPIVKESGTM